MSRPSGTGRADRNVELIDVSEVVFVGTPNGLRPARLKVGIISAGRVGTALGVALERAEHVVVGCSAISTFAPAGRTQAARHTGTAGSRRRRPRRTVVADSARLRTDRPDRRPGRHGIGAAGNHRRAHLRGQRRRMLAPLAEHGCVPLAIHPAMTFTGADEDIARLTDTCFGITAADEIGYAIAQSLVLEIGGEPFGVREDARTLYHAALAHASNHVVTLVADALNALRAALAGQELLGQELIVDAPGGLAERIIGPLARPHWRTPCSVGRPRSPVRSPAATPQPSPPPGRAQRCRSPTGAGILRRLAANRATSTRPRGGP